MKGDTLTIIATAEAVIRQLHQRSKQDVQDDVEYISTLKAVIQGAASTAINTIGKQQVKKELTTYARNLYVQDWQDDSHETHETHEERLYWFDYIYEHEAYPE